MELAGLEPATSLGVQESSIGLVARTERVPSPPFAAVCHLYLTTT